MRNEILMDGKPVPEHMRSTWGNPYWFYAHMAWCDELRKYFDMRDMKPLRRPTRAKRKRINRLGKYMWRASR